MTLEETIGYTFKDKNLLKLALTHSSYANEHGGELKSNERLEFLGDSILSVIVSEHIYNAMPTNMEGDLTRVRASLVCERALAEYAEEINLGSYILLSHGEEMTNGRDRPSITSDAYEALIAAIFIDGGMDAAVRFVLPRVVSALSIQKQVNDDPKTRLQELVQRKKGSKIEYILAKESGPDHDKVFETELYINGKLMGNGIAGSKKESEQIAAAAALKKLQND